MQERNKIGIIILLFFSSIAFGLALYANLSPTSLTYYNKSTWFIILFALGSIVLGLKMFKKVSSMLSAFTILFIVIAGILSLIVGLYWVLICLIVSLIGCVIYKAGRLS